MASHKFNDLKLACQNLNQLVNQIKAIYHRYLTENFDCHYAVSEIKALLAEYDEQRVPDKTNIVSLFPEEQPFIHINQSYYSPSSSHEHQINLVLTFTPSPSGHRITILVHPNIAVNDAYVDFLELTPLKYAALPIFRGRDVTHECTFKEHQVEWSLRRVKGGSSIKINAHPGDKIIFYSTDGLDYTVTSCNEKGDIPINPDNDLALLEGRKCEVIIDHPGDYYFTSRAHKKLLRLHVHIKSCPYHA